MSLESDLRTAILADPNVALLIGERYFYSQFPQRATYPAVAAQRISTVPLYVHTLGSEQATFQWARFQFVCAGGGPDGAIAALDVAAAIIAAVKTFNLAAMPSSPTVLRQAPNFVVNQRAMSMPQTQQPIFAQVLDLRVAYNELN